SSTFPVVAHTLSVSAPKALAHQKSHNTTSPLQVGIERSQRNRILVKKQKSKNFVILATLVVVLVFYLLQREIQLGNGL
ncbi:MAG: hypothetical protein LBU31_00625, partial [Coriobacteriales bacterium]|nr:hypothetical protein [Coriobacteriales bacterium]